MARSKKQSFSIPHPHLLEEWDYRKNRSLGLDPEELTYGSNKKAWWVCSEGHSWEAAVCKRVFGKGCPYCSNKKVGYGNDLLTKHPDLCEQWDYEKNKLGPENYTPGSNKKVWWKCSEGHSWETVVLRRTQLESPTGCPYCSNQKVGYGNDLLTNHPDLCREWDYEKNKLGPENYTVYSGKKVWWKCSKGHSWSTVVYSRVYGRGCSYCVGKKTGYGNDLLTNQPDLCKEWDYEKNELGPENFTPSSGKKVWWVCCESHSWQASIHNRQAGNGCPYCGNKKVGYGNDLLTNHPELCQEWDYEKNKLGPENFTPSSGKKVWWKCCKGHSWESFIYNRSSQGCPVCNKGNVSPISQRWLDSLGVELREVRLKIPYGKRKSMIVDGFDPETNTIYEFLGDYWHGNPKVYSAQEKNPSVNKTFGQLYCETKKRILRLEKMGYRVIYIWESSFKSSLGGFRC